METKQNQTQFVRHGYDRIAEKYAAQRDDFDNRTELEQFANHLPQQACVLDAGCGAGVPVCSYLCEKGHRVTGIDISDSMLTLARANVPEAEFMSMDMLAIDLPLASFDGLTAFYSIFHVPRERHRELFARFHDLLRPGGVILVSLGHTDWEGTEDFFGVPMFWSHLAPPASLKLLREVGFEEIFDRTVVSHDEEHYWVLARKQG